MMNEPRAAEPGRPLVSVVVPALNEAENVQSLISRLVDLQSELASLDFELVVVDDGSVDRTAALVHELAPADLPVTTVELARSFGSHHAITAGLRACRGDCAIVLGADGQEPTSLVSEFLALWRSGSDVVWGIRKNRARGLRHELPSKLFSHLFTRYADLANYPAEGPSGVLLDRAVIDELNQLEESNRNVLALVAWLGFRQSRVLYEQLPREHGESRWTRRKMIKLAIDSLIQFSHMPLRACTFTGIGVAVVGLIYAAFLVARSFAGVDTPSGWPTILVVVLVLGGIQLTVIGIMGEYLWRAVEEVRRRPLYVVRETRHSGPTVRGRADR